jgi:hypothetical protein
MNPSTTIDLDFPSRVAQDHPHRRRP